MPNPLGPSIQIDPAFPYYANRSAESIVDEIELAGYRTVRYFVTEEKRIHGKLLEALQKRGIFVWAMTLGNGVYTTGHLPKEWPRWQMTLLKPVEDGFYRFSPYSQSYTAWKKNALAQMVRNYPFDGLEIAEPYFPEWNGLSSGVYGDVGPLARLAFRKKYGSDIPDFKYASSANYYKRNTSLYADWVQFRVDSVNRFLAEMIHGAGGVKHARPGIQIATWSVAVDHGPDSVELIREFQGIDAPSMISAVKPDVHFIQTHWPDWMRPSLKANYVTAYEPFTRQIRMAHPQLPLGIQADIGSKRNMRRSTGWLRQFRETAGKLNYATWTAYEYHLGRYMYEEPPLPLQAKRVGRNIVLLLFNKRVDESSAENPQHYQMSLRGAELKIQDLKAEADGNRILLWSALFPQEPFELTLSGIQDTPSLWLFQQAKANKVPRNCSVTVPPYRH
ncbi:N-acyl-D-glucosamine 2-epimerase [Paenibacillus thalictri]|uniref:N-acyl-D-glucosamine 2-epimerase n=1 Tax=Paenibacillus thalictri TaxID=2527873 RepID=A0A4Q9DTQ5_9BACL|nr:N-acyl-D-glucosamine 2-epimerase [Paenibacillus thalictri]TBL80333.1 N-acyl-D-glucosamine 2-epimerase [Paenibacillus thalictri]